MAEMVKTKFSSTSVITTELIPNISERAAPSPTGFLHLGHAFSALTAFKHVNKKNGMFKLRIEDIDYTRCKTEFEDLIYEDLAWLGIEWVEPVLRQSERFIIYHEAINTLKKMGVIYGCSCSRSDINQVLSAPNRSYFKNQKVYPGTCREKNLKDGPLSLRLNTKMALKLIDKSELFFHELGSGPELQKGKQCLIERDIIAEIGDPVIARKDIRTSYNLAVVVDDMAQNITHITRGLDLFSSTPIQVILQKLLGYKTPFYRHHKLITDKNGVRLAKRSNATSIKHYRKKGFNPEDIWEMVKD